MFHYLCEHVPKRKRAYISQKICKQVVAACCYLLLLLVVVSCCCYLLLLLVVVTCCCYLLLLLVVVVVVVEPLRKPPGLNQLLLFQLSSFTFLPTRGGGGVVSIIFVAGDFCCF